MSRMKKPQACAIVEEEELTDEEVSQEDDVSSSVIQDIDLLSDHGITKLEINKLKAAGIHTCKAVVMLTKKKLCNVKGLTEPKAEKIREAVNKICCKEVFRTALAINQMRQHIFKITTGSEELDSILGGGIESMSITEAFGEFRCGKTQLAHTMCITCQVNRSQDNFIGGKAIFVDTENTFRPDRLKRIARRFDLDENEALSNVIVARAYTSEQQYDIIETAANILYEGDGSFKLIVVDSVMALFRVDFCGRGELADRQQKLAQFLSRVQKLCEEYNTAVFLTNQMTADPGANMSFQVDPKKPIGGHILAHASTTRISLKKGKGNERIARIYDSPDMPEAEAKFCITDGGVADTTG